MLKSLIIVSIMLISSVGLSKVVTVDPDRTIRVTGVIDSSTIQTGNKILRLSDNDPDEPIYLIINSGGGSVLAGTQIITMMRIAQNRGTRIVCIVPMVAASMAFQILAECDTRYTFRYSLLLWHPIRVQIRGILTPRRAIQLAEEMERYEKAMVRVLLERLGIERDVFDYHYYNETLHLSENLIEIAPGFIEIVDDVQGVPNMFSMRP